MSDDDDWETAPIAALSLDDDKPTARVANPDAQRSNGVLIMPKHMQGLQGLSSAQVNFMHDEPIGSVVSRAAEDRPTEPILLDVLGNPKERLNFLKLEDDIVKFLESGDDEMELPPPRNSYFGSATFKLVQRFNLRMRKDGEEPYVRTVLVRTADARLPKTLLIELGAETDLPQEGTEASTVRGSDGTTSGGAAPSIASKPKVRTRCQNRAA